MDGFEPGQLYKKDIFDDDVGTITGVELSTDDKKEWILNKLNVITSGINYKNFLLVNKDGWRIRYPTFKMTPVKINQQVKDNPV